MQTGGLAQDIAVEGGKYLDRLGELGSYLELAQVSTPCNFIGSNSPLFYQDLQALPLIDVQDPHYGSLAKYYMRLSKGPLSTSMLFPCQMTSRLLFVMSKSRGVENEE